MVRFRRIYVRRANTYPEAINVGSNVWIMDNIAPTHIMETPTVIRRLTEEDVVPKPDVCPVCLNEMWVRDNRVWCTHCHPSRIVTYGPDPNARYVRADGTYFDPHSGEQEAFGKERNIDLHECQAENRRLRVLLELPDELPPKEETLAEPKVTPYEEPSHDELLEAWHRVGHAIAYLTKEEPPAEEPPTEFCDWCRGPMKYKLVEIKEWYCPKCIDDIKKFPPTEEPEFICPECGSNEWWHPEWTVEWRRCKFCGYLIDKDGGKYVGAK